MGVLRKEHGPAQNVTGEPGPSGLALVTAPSVFLPENEGLDSAARRASSSATA